MEKETKSEEKKREKRAENASINQQYNVTRGKKHRIFMKMIV
jgi:hypothetical protein